MPKTKQQKQELINVLAEKLGKMRSVVFTSVSGYTMKDADVLRTKGKAEGVDFLVTKKTLLMRALEKNNIPLSKNLIDGSILTAISYNDEVVPAKLLKEFSKDREGIVMIGGILEGALVDAAAVKQLASIPSKQELYAKIVGSINAPVSGFVNILAGNIRGLVVALNAIVQSKS